MSPSSTFTPVSDQSVTAAIENGTLKHIAIIMDGNRRWAKSRRLPSAQGHYRGYQALKTIVRYCSKQLHLPVLTVYAFSTENWRRSDQEVRFLLKLFHQTLQAELDEMMAENVRLRFLGDIQAFSPAFQQACREAEALTANNTGLIYQVALNYGGRSEMLKAVQSLAQAAKVGQLEPDEITEAHIARCLYTGEVPDPDMVIRTGGEYRLSNFLLWQAAYAEICVVDELWPDFTPEVLDRTILTFQNRQRRFGK